MKRLNRILIIDDNQAVVNYLEVLLMQTAKFDVYPLTLSTKAFDVIAEYKPDLILLDMDMPDVKGIDILKYLVEKIDRPEVLILSGVEDIRLAVASMKLGAYDYITKPVDPEELLEVMERALDRRMLKTEIRLLRKDGKDRSEGSPFADIITRTTKMKKIFKYIEAIAPTDNPVLIWGESGTGKELIARAIHRLSGRRDQPFLAINAGVLANELFSSEFFGHTKGAFTGASADKPGILEKSNGGVLFLDEIGELSLPIQVKLLRFLQEGEYFQVGSTKCRYADVRVITATNKNLQEEIPRGNFRNDLFYRLNVCSIHAPPLRERQEDIPLLAHYFVEKYGQVHKKRLSRISEDVLMLLHRYHYPGNIRELENIINSALLLENSLELKRKSLPQYFLEATLKAKFFIADAHNKTMSQVEKEHIERVLNYTRGNRTAAARILGISRVSLISKIKNHDIKIAPRQNSIAS
ncbi:MAG: sigma-54 dependent transcriptional regulator [bacterium]|nr:sigma-54 dependent transcriptional regulator [bacterium]